MTEFILGPSGSGKTTIITDRVLSDLSQGKHVILLVPEQAAVLVESLVSYEAQKRNIPQIRLEVLNFKRLCNRVFREFGGITYHGVNNSAKVLLLWEALFATSPYLSRYASEVENASRFIPTLLSAINECKAYCVTPSDLDAAAKACHGEDDKLSAKLSDLSLIYAEYYRLLESGFSDPSDDLSRLDAILAEHQFFRGVSLYLDGFVGFTPQEYRVLSRAVKQADSVTVTFCTDSDGNSMAFENADRELKHLIELCGSTPPVITYLKETHRFREPELQYLERNLWSVGQSPKFPAASRAIRLIQAKGLYDEAEFVANDITRRVRNGAEYRDFAVIARDISSYSGIIDAVFDKYDLPCHIAKRIPLAEKPVFRLILSALAIKMHGWSVEDVISYVKTGLTDITPDECDELESYVSTWNITGKRWYNDEEWYMNPDGYTDRLTTEGRALLSRVNAIRKRIVLPLIKLHESLDGTHTVKGVCHAVYTFLIELGVDARIDAQGDNEDYLLWNTLCDTLDTMVNTIPDRRCDAKLYHGLFSLAVSQASSGSLPAVIDEIAVGSADRIRAVNVRHVYLLGVNEGVFPAACSESGLFTDTEKAMLETVNVVLSPNSNAATISELFRFYTSACSASDSLTVLCSTQDLGGASLKPSLAFTRLQALFPSSRLIDTSKLSYDQRIENKKASFEIMKQFSETEEREALSRLFRNDPDYAHYLDTDRQPLITSEEKLDSEALSALFTGDLSLTQSRLDSYVLCAFGYECTYALKLKETKRAEFKASDTGNLVHRILEKFFYTATSGHESVPPMTDKEIDTLLDSIFDEYLFTIFGKTHDERYTGRIGQLFFRLRRLVRVLIRNLLDEFAQSEFVPTFFEMPISSSGVEGSVAPLAIPLPDGTHAYIYGIADRVDICRRGNDVYVRVVDYKTGQKDFSLYDISLGLNLQMLLYLFSIWKDETGSFRRAVSCSGDIIPSGVLYCTAKPSEITVAGDLTDEQIYAKVEDTLKRKGLLLNDEEVLRMMEKKLDGKYIPVTLKKDGSLSTSLTLESLEGLGKLMDDIMTTISRLAGEMKSGVATCRPLKDAKHDACRFCPHKPVCRNPSALS